MRVSRFLNYALFWVLAVAEGEQQCESSSGTCPSSDYYEPLECNLWLGESSIPHGGLGVYAGKEFLPNDIIGSGEIMIPVVDNLFLAGDSNYAVDDITWSPELNNIFYFEGLNRTEIIYPGMGACANSHLGLHNVDSTNFGHDRSLVSGQDPGMGAFSYYYNLQSKALTKIAKGHELFVNYGDEWFLQRASYLGNVPVAQDYPVVNKLLRTLHMKLLKNGGDAQDQVLQDLYEVIRTSGVDNARIQFAMPKALDEVENAAKMGVQYHHLPHVVRDEEWLRKEAYCVDLITVKNSTLPHAGRGAFATRDLPQGTMVAPLPVLPLNRTYLNVSLPLYGHVETHVVKGKQLLTNYVYAHPASNVVLLNYGFNTNFVNHGFNGTANVKVQWSRRSYHKAELLELKAHMVTRKTFGMMLEFVALRDIQQGEEILLDYGKEWEEAWNRHMASWETPNTKKRAVL